MTVRYKSLSFLTKNIETNMFLILIYHPSYLLLSCVSFLKFSVFEYKMF
jgi:hypothetical protein